MDCSRSKAQRRASAAVEDGPARSAAQFEDGAPFRSREASITAVFLQLLLRIASFLPRNEVACVLRLLCKAAAATLRGPQHATVHMSEPAPPAEFQWRWCGPQSLRSTTLKQRRQLEELTARSGVVANLGALAEAHGGDLPFLPSPPCYWGPLEMAARAGRLEACRWLHAQRGVPLTIVSLIAAASGGHADVCEWLLERGCEWSFSAVANALHQGHVAAAERLLQLGPEEAAVDPLGMMSSAADGCDLATLQRLHAEHVAGRGLDESADAEPYSAGERCLAGAAGSRTPDWAAKVEWLERLGCPRTGTKVCEAAARCKEGGAARLPWLCARGYSLDAGSAAHAALTGAGNAEALRHVLAQRGLQLAPHHLSSLLSAACSSGNLEAVQVLWDAGGRPDAGAVAAAALNGHLHVVSWAVEQLGDGGAAALTADVFRAAVKSGSLTLLRWLHERGCPWDADAMAAAAKAGSKEALERLHERGCPWGDDNGTWADAAGAGCEEALEWLAGRGCPMGGVWDAYVEAAGHNDMRTLRCLARLGCPFPPNGSTFTIVAANSAPGRLPFNPQPLQWLLDAGCPVNWGEVMSACANHQHAGPLREWVTHAAAAAAARDL